MNGAPWIVLSVNSLYAYAASVQVDAFRQKYVVLGQTDPFTETMTPVVARIRTACETGGFALSATPNSIPPETVDYACWLILCRLGSRIGWINTDDQKALIKQAEDYIDGIRDGDYRVTMPVDPVTSPVTQTPHLISVVTKEKRYSSQDFAGL